MRAHDSRRGAWVPGLILGPGSIRAPPRAPECRAMTAVRLSAIAFAALALLPATASAATVTVTGDDGNPLAINTSAPTAIRQMDVSYAVTFDGTDGAYHKTAALGPDGVARLLGYLVLPEERDRQHQPLRRLPRQRQLRRRRADLHQQACTAGAKEQRFLYSISAGTAITPPDGVVLTRQPNSFSTITHKVPVALNPGGARLRGQVRPRRRDRPRRRHLRPLERRVHGPQHRPRRRPLHRARPVRDGRPHQERRLLHAVERPDQLRRSRRRSTSPRGLPGPGRPELQAARHAARPLRPRQAA